MTNSNSLIKAQISTILGSGFYITVKANLIAEQLRHTTNKEEFFALFYDCQLKLQENLFPYIEFDNESLAYDNIIVTVFDSNCKPVEYTFKFHKDTNIQVNYETCGKQFLVA